MNFSVPFNRTVPYLVLLAQVLIFYRHVLFYEGFVIPWDLRYDHFPVATFVADSFQRGELPLWDPYTYCGRPLYANIQAQVFYPPTVAAILLSNAGGGENLLYLLEWQLVLHVFLGGVFTCWLLLRLNATRAAALAGATIYQLGGFFASQTQHLGGVNAAAWMPLAWLSVIALRDRLEWRWFLALTVSLAMCVFSGLPALMAVVFSSCLLLAAALMIFKPAGARFPAAVVLSCLWALLLAAVQLIPTTELTFQSVAKYRADWLGSGGGMPLESLVSLVWPNYYGIFDLETFSWNWEPTFLYAYCGLGGLVLALLGAIAGKSKETSMFAVVTALSALWMLGDSTVVGSAIYSLLPDRIKIGLHPEFALAVFVLSIAITAGLGAHQFLRRPVLGYAAVAVIAADLILTGSGRPMNTASVAEEPGVAREHFDGHEDLLLGVRQLVNETVPPARIDTVNDSLSWAMCAPLTLVPTTNGNDPFAPARLIQARLAFCEGERWGRYYEVSRLDSPVLDLMNVGYVISREPLDAGRLEQAKFVHAAELPGHQVYENTEILPRFFLVGRVRQVNEMSEAVAVLHSAGFDPRHEAVVEGAVDFVNSAEPAAGTVKVLQYAPREVILEVFSPTPAYLVTSETHYPGWQAFVSGDKQPIFHTNVAFRGFPVPEGRHEVVMKFAPSILTYSAAVSAVAWCGLIGLWLGIRARRRGGVGI